MWSYFWRRVVLYLWPTALLLAFSRVLLLCRKWYMYISCNLILLHDSYEIKCLLNSVKIPSQQLRKLYYSKCIANSCFFVFFSDSNVSLALTPLNSFNESYFDQDHFMSPCSDFNMTFFTASLKRTNDSQTQWVRLTSFKQLLLNIIYI